VTAANSLLSSSEQIVLSVRAVGGQKPRAVDHLRKASRRLRSADEVSPHNAVDAHDNLATGPSNYLTGPHCTVCSHMC